MSKKLWLFVFLFFIILAHAVLLAVDWTRPIVFNAYVTVGTMFLAGVASVGASEWWLMYGVYITAVSCLSMGIFLTAMYYKGKIKMWQWGAKKAVETAYGSKQPAPAPTPLATAPIIPEEKKEVAA
jgi:hypothetical protein